MAIERHVVELSARDTLTPVLKKVGTEAERAGRQADDAGKKASRSMQDWGRAASALGTALGVGIGASIKIFNEAEVVQARLRQSVENTGHSYEEYADAIDKASESALKLAFDDEDAANSIAALTDATGDAGKAINDLALAQDIARGRGIDLAAATNIVIAAETGRIQSLKRMGIALDASATSEEALAALQQKYAGQAEAYARTNQATWDRLGNTIENRMESIGGALADFQGPLVALSAGATALGPLGQAFEALDGKAKLARASSLALGAAMSPAGLALGALGAAAGITYLINQMNRYDDAAEQAARSTLDLENFFKSLASSLDPVNKRILTDLYTNLDQIIDDAAQRQSDLDKLLTLQLGITNEGIDISTDAAAKLAAETTGLTVEQLKWVDTNHDLSVSVDEVNAAVTLFQTNLDRLNADQVKEVQANIQSLFSKSNLDYEKAAAAVSDLNRQLEAGLLTPEQYVQAISDLAANYGDLLTGMADDTEQFAITAKRAWGGLRLEGPKTLDDIAKSFTRWQTTLDATGDSLITTFADAEDGLDGVAGSAAGADSSLTGAATGFDRATRGAVAATGATNDLDDQLSSLSDTLGSMTPASVLDSTFGAIVGYTDQIVGSIDKVKQWSDAIMAPLGTDFQGDGSMSKMLDLLNRGKIDTEDYNEALDAQTRIYGDLGRAQDAQAIIQIKQSNYIADAADVTADYLESISKLPEAEQATALAWADSDISGRAEDIAGMAAEWDNMSTAQQQAFEETTLSAAKLDPMLANLLFNLGLIKGDINDPSSWTLSMDSSDAESDMDRLTDAINHLSEVIAGVPDVNVDVNADTSNFYAQIGGIPQIVGDRYVNVHGVGFMMATGGVSPWPDTAALGRVSAGNATLVGENGPEIVNLPGGALVTPNHASRYMTPNGGGGVTFNGPVTVVANDPQSFMRQMRSYQQSVTRR